MMDKSTARILSGEVVSDKMEKSVVVKIVRQVKHPLYKKIVRKTSKVLAHDESNSYKVGDKVSVVESPRFSKRKAWKVLDQK